MYTKIQTSRVSLPFVVLLFFSFTDSRSLMLKDGHHYGLQDKEIFPLQFNSMTTSQFDKQDSAQFGATTISTSRIKEFSNAFKRKPYFGETNDLYSTSERKCERNPTKRRRRRYVLEGSKIRKTDITWGIAVFSKKLTHSEQINILEMAFRTWAAHCALSFTYESDPSKADVVIKFVQGNHGDQIPFDDAGDIKAHGFYPSSGSDIHFDEYENWVADPKGVGGISLLSAAIHEIGHSLGLRHSSVPNAVMFPILTDGKNSLNDDDIKGIQALYGKCTIRKLDAVVTSNTGNNLRDKALVFKNAWVWDVDIRTARVNFGYPRKIRDLFVDKKLDNKHPFKVVFYEHRYNNYVFMNNDGYFVAEDSTRFRVEYKYAYGQKGSFFPFLKNVGPPDAAFVDPDHGNIYHFFKGTQYYQFNMNTFKLMPGYPKAINTVWPYVPSNLDAVYYNFNEKVYYLIKADQYYKLIKTNSKFVFYSVGMLKDIFKNICPI